MSAVTSDSRAWSPLDSAIEGIPYAEIIGDPVAQSKSPLIHKYWLSTLRIAGDYRRCHVPKSALADYLAVRSSEPLWRGCNATMPHKQALLDMVADPHGLRSRIGALNIVHKAPHSRALAGDNSDVGGFLAPLAADDLSDWRAVVVGAGGAARAVVVALTSAGCRSITLINRDQAKAAAVLADLGLSQAHGRVHSRVLALGAPLPSADILVNASSLGMHGSPPLVLDLSVLPPSAIVYDIVYSPLDTALLQQARARGLRTIDGLAMLIGQAARSFELFFHHQPPQDSASLAELRKILTAG